MVSLTTRQRFDTLLAAKKVTNLRRSTTPMQLGPGDLTRRTTTGTGPSGQSVGGLLFCWSQLHAQMYVTAKAGLKRLESVSPAAIESIRTHNDWGFIFLQAGASRARRDRTGFHPGTPTASDAGFKPHVSPTPRPKTIPASL